MCGFLVTSRSVSNLEQLTEYISRRGPDASSCVNYKGVLFFHALLSITGQQTTQPFLDAERGLAAIFNGEIYNYEDFGDFTSDGHCLLPLYRQYGIDFVSRLDGEFALAIFDFNRDIMIVSTDIFSTKPLWIARSERDFALGSYASSLKQLGFSEFTQVPANTTLVSSIRAPREVSSRHVWNFCLKQHKSNFKDWNAAFSRSVEKRTRSLKHGVFIGLSSGYDSGTIACELTRLNVEFRAYSILGAENSETLTRRHALLKNGQHINLSREKFMAARSYLSKYCEDYFLNIDEGEQERLQALEDESLALSLKLKPLRGEWLSTKLKLLNTPMRKRRQRQARIEKRIQSLREKIRLKRAGQLLQDDNGAIGMSHICSLARPRGELIYLSGSGADEIFSDYGFQGIRHFGHSTIGGHFADNLPEYFPWKNFFGNTQRAYLMKEEYVTGSYGIEGRYPFLDRDVVQEFLWLKPELKNRHYKAPLHQYMEGNNYPFDVNEKVGFSCGFSSRNDGYEENLNPHRLVGREKRSD